MTSFMTLFRKEVLRFWKVAFQTVGAPILTALLYLLIFANALEGHVTVHGGIGYRQFLVPGLVMMGVLQNSFANTSSSLIQSKVTGNLVFILLTPISYREFFIAYVLAAVTRGLAVGAGVLSVCALLVNMPVEAPLWAMAFALVSAAIMGSMGLIAGIWAEKFEHLAAFQNFVVLPLIFLSGVFYSLHSLSPFWQAVSRFNPFFYMIDGFRYGFFGVSDAPPAVSLTVVGATLTLLAIGTLSLLKSGYKLRH